MPQATFSFPNGFLWGTATAAHQVEGNNTNNDWADWEAEPSRIKDNHRSGLACDWWNGRWKEDFDLAIADGQNAHRFSIEWSRIQPAPDQWNDDALETYRSMLSYLCRRGITPMVTLHHFTNPRWLADQGGWESNETPDLFAEFARRLVDALKDYVTLWITINEPNVYTYNAYLDGVFPPGKRDINSAIQVIGNLVRGHAKAYKIIHKIQPEARVGVAHHYRSFQPARPWFPLDRLVTKVQHKVFNDLFPHALKTGILDFVYKKEAVPEALNTQDFFGINYYTGDLVSFCFSVKSFFSRRTYRKGSYLSETGFIAHYPEGMAEAVRWANQFGLPMIITENGIEDSQDTVRPTYILDHLHQLWRMINNNILVKGYFYWTLVDNFEWERGWTQRFGLWELDTVTQRRIRRPSADLYAAICKENSFSSAMIKKYAPEIVQKLLPE